MHTCDNTLGELPSRPRNCRQVDLRAGKPVLQKARRYDTRIASVGRQNVRLSSLGYPHGRRCSSRSKMVSQSTDRMQCRSISISSTQCCTCSMLIRLRNSVELHEVHDREPGFLENLHRISHIRDSTVSEWKRLAIRTYPSVVLLQEPTPLHRVVAYDVATRVSDSANEFASPLPTHVKSTESKEFSEVRPDQL